MNYQDIALRETGEKKIEVHVDRDFNNWIRIVNE